MQPLSAIVHCEHAAECGACAFLDLEYSKQLRRKQVVLARAMEHQRGPLGDKLKSTLPSPSIAGYRNRARMAIGISRHGPIRVGYFRPSSREIVDAPHCQVLVPEVLDTTRGIRRLLERDPKALPRQLRHIDVRCGSDPRRQHLILVLRSDSLPRLPIDAIRKACRHVDGISVNLNPSSGPQVLKGRIEPLWGARDLFVDTAGLRLRVSPGSFFQVNLDILPEIHRAMAEFFAPGSDLLDLYSGVGTHGLALRGQFRHLTFVEGVRAAVADTKSTLERYSLDQARVVAKPVERATRQWLEADAEAVVMNPSRAGATPDVLDALGQSAARQVAYLSCDPMTLARDLDTLVRQRFRLVSLQPIDMMPQTRQVEALALLER